MMAMSIKNPEVERLARELAEALGETKTEAIRKALLERRQRLAFRLAPRDRAAEMRRFLEQEIWPTIPDDQRGRRLGREEEDAILGYGPEGV